MQPKEISAEKDSPPSFFLRTQVELLPTAALLFVSLTLINVLSRLRGRPETFYSATSIHVNLLEQYPVLALIAIAVGILFLWYFRQQLRWADVGLEPYRWFAVVLALALAWNYALMDCNHYFGQWHLADRCLLVLLAIAVWASPFVLLPFLFSLVLFQGQFSFPADGLIPHFWQEKALPIRLLVLIGSCAMLSTVTKHRKWQLLFLMLTFVACHYWPSAWSKVEMGWIQHNDLSLVVLSAYANGWRQDLSFDELAQVSNQLAGFSGLAAVLTQVVELAVVLLVLPANLVRRKLSRACMPYFTVAILLALALLHLGIVVFSGVFFLNWLITDIALALLIFVLARREDEQIRFSAAQFIAFLLLVFSGSWWIEQTRFSWFETRLCYSYRFEAEFEGGGRQILPAEVFSPHDFAFTWTVMDFLYPGKQLAVSYGNAADEKTTSLVNTARSIEEILSLERSHGIVLYDKERVEAMKEFLTRFFSNRNENLEKPSWLDSIQRPCEIISHPRQPNSLSSAAITKVRAIRVTTFFDGATFDEVRKEELFVVDIPAKARGLESGASARKN